MFRASVTIKPMKFCPRCKDKKELSEFSKSQREKDGLQQWCKKCCQTYRRSNKGKEAHQRSSRKYQQTDAGKEASRKAHQKHRQTDKGKKTDRKASQKRRLLYPEKVKANSMVRCAIAAGTLTRPSHCESCLKKRFVEGHHEDYSKPLDVDWLCNKCHIEKR